MARAATASLRQHPPRRAVPRSAGNHGQPIRGWRRGGVRTLAALLTAALVASCSLPRVYRLTVQQGNVITQEMVDSLKPGMTREQVAYIMGEPVVRNPFDQDRWDYVYTLRVPRFVDDQARLSLFFADGQLTHFSGDFKPSAEGGQDDADGEDANAAG